MCALPSYAALLNHCPVPSDYPADVFPYTLHAQHRRFGDPREMELYLTFREPHRVRYTTVDGVLHDEYIEVKYEFTTIEGSMQFQGDIRSKDLIDWYDVDVVWSDSHRRTDSYGNVRGLGTIQRMKLWRDRYSTFHYLTFFANHRRRWKEYLVHDFERELRSRDDRHRRLQINARGARRGSASESSNHGHGHGRERRFSASSIFRPRNSGSSSHAGSSSSAHQSAVDIRYLGIQFTRNDRMQPGTDGKLSRGSRPPRANLKIDYRRFIESWSFAHDSDDQFDVSLPSSHAELESPTINGMPDGHAPHVNGVAELPSPEMVGLAPVYEPADSDDTP